MFFSYHGDESVHNFHLPGYFFSLIEGQKVMEILSNKFIGYKLVWNIKETIQIVKEQLVQKSQIKIENK